MKLARNVAGLALTILAAILAPTFARASDLLQCEPIDAVTLGDDGRLERNAATNVASTDGYIIDLSTGAVRITSGSAILGPAQWIVVQEGGSGNDTVLVPAGLESPTLRTAATDSIRVRRWSIETDGQLPIRFVRYSLTTMISGTCEAIM